MVDPGLPLSSLRGSLYALCYEGCAYQWLLLMLVDIMLSGVHKNYLANNYKKSDVSARDATI